MILTRGAGQAVLIASAYFVLSALTVRYTRFGGGVAFIWAAGPLLMAALTVTSRRRWPLMIGLCLVANAVATALFGLGPAAAIPFATINVAEAALAAWLLRRWSRSSGRFSTVGEIAWFLAIAGIVAPGFVAFASASTVYLLNKGPFWPNWFAAGAGHALGAITVAPLAMLLIRRGSLARIRRELAGLRRFEATVLLSIVAGVAFAVFSQSGLPLLFLPFLPLVISVFRLGLFGAAVSVGLITMIGSILTVRGLGPINMIDADNGARALFLQLYLATAVLTALPAAGELHRRQRLFGDLTEREALHRLILDRTGDIVMTLRLDGTIRYVSPSIERIGGYRPADLVGRLPHALIDPADIVSVISAHRQALAAPNETFIVSYRARTNDGQLGWFETHTRATVDEVGNASGAVSIIREITARKEAEAALELAAATDPLTALANRRAFDAALAAIIERGGVATLALFDLDRFKTVNDTWGHATGDDVIRAFANVLRGAVREGDVIARLGGEEFALVLPGADIDQARTICERVRMRFADTSVEAPGGAQVRCSVSAGLAALRPSVAQAQLVASADRALYRAKAEGRNRLELAA